MIGRQTVEAHKTTYEGVRDQFLSEYNALLGQFQLLRDLHGKGRASTAEVAAKREEVLEAKARLDMAVGAWQAVMNLMKEFGIDKPEIALDTEAVRQLGPGLEAFKAEQAAAGQAADGQALGDQLKKQAHKRKQPKQPVPQPAMNGHQA